MVMLDNTSAESLGQLGLSLIKQIIVIGRNFVYCHRNEQFKKKNIFITGHNRK